MNSFRFLEKALEYEAQGRKRCLIPEGKSSRRPTCGSINNRALPMRSKEDAHDYRYFPEPDLLPLMVIIR
jgi:aspartyl-tRNA(Asn)/glutamyl-tRNA(Gln) amidotransferase subunit B